MRDLIRDRLRQYRDAGLGDPDDATLPADADAPGRTAPLPAAAREFATEARRLRELTSSDRV